MAEHVLLCQDAGKVETLQETVSFLDEWLAESGTDPGLWRYITRVDLTLRQTLI
jgi:hypothetical protein